MTGRLILSLCEGIRLTIIYIWGNVIYGIRIEHVMETVTCTRDAQCLLWNAMELHGNIAQNYIWETQNLLIHFRKWHLHKNVCLFEIISFSTLYNWNILNTVLRTVFKKNTNLNFLFSLKILFEKKKNIMCRQVIISLFKNIHNLYILIFNENW